MLSDVFYFFKSTTLDELSLPGLVVKSERATLGKRLSTLLIDRVEITKESARKHGGALDIYIHIRLVPCGRPYFFCSDQNGTSRQATIKRVGDCHHGL